ncbi:MAG TPA: 4-(cytidine 5'-diphospho)-2-C-methyl-D-erythritol kinase [bacterium]|nr:4-(cytidine 5'-diphospho)-2-C-methyl-D-erythritol kinase [bacterium]
MSAPALKVKTPAKVNWALEVLRRRDDGFHELALVFQAVGLWDELSFWKKASGLELAVLESPVPLGTDPSNLVLRAARLFFEAAGLPEGLRVELTKRIPVAAGLGGGSSDAAATLWALNRLYGTDFSLAQLRHLGAQLGSDVPFFLTGGTALGLGRGEQVTPWDPAPTRWLVLVKPQEGLSTPAVYGSGRAAFSTGEKALGMKAALTGGNGPLLAASLFNSLEPAAFHLLPEVEALKNGLLRAGALGALVSGSGPTVFGLAADEAAARAVAEKMRTLAPTVWVVPTVAEGPRIVP